MADEGNGSLGVHNPPVRVAAAIKGKSSPQASCFSFCHSVMSERNGPLISERCPRQPRRHGAPVPSAKDMYLFQSATPPSPNNQSEQCLINVTPPPSRREVGFSGSGSPALVQLISCFLCCHAQFCLGHLCLYFCLPSFFFV